MSFQEIGTCELFKYQIRFVIALLFAEISTDKEKLFLVTLGHF